MRDEVHNLPKGNSGIDTKNFRLLFAGYSWREKQFKAWVFSYDTNDTKRRSTGFIYPRI